jgi:DNA-nicking Smr family endonuclease
MRIEVHPEAREELLEFLRRVECKARADGEGAVIVEVPDAADEQARLEVDLYLKAWLASHPDVEAHLLKIPHSGVEVEAETSD